MVSAINPIIIHVHQANFKLSLAILIQQFCTDYVNMCFQQQRNKKGVAHANEF